MIAEEMATQKTLDLEIARLRADLEHLKELWKQQAAADAVALILRTAQVEEHMGNLNHARTLAAEVARTTVDSTRYEEQMAELRVHLQGVKDTARDQLGVSVDDFARQLASALGLVATNKEDVDIRFNALSLEMKQDLAHRAGVAEATSAEAKKDAGDAKDAAGRARSLSFMSAIISALAAVTALVTALWKFLKGVTP